MKPDRSTNLPGRRRSGAVRQSPRLPPPLPVPATAASRHGGPCSFTLVCFAQPCSRPFLSPPALRWSPRPGGAAAAAAARPGRPEGARPAWLSSLSVAPRFKRLRRLVQPASSRAPTVLLPCLPVLRTNRCCYTVLTPELLAPALLIRCNLMCRCIAQEAEPRIPFWCTRRGRHNQGDVRAL